MSDVVASDRFVDVTFPSMLCIVMSLQPATLLLFSLAEMPLALHFAMPRDELDGGMHH